jgi:hypothetical protein
MLATIVSLYLLLFAVPAEIVVASLPARGDIELPMMPAGKVEISHSGPFSRVRVEIDRVAPASSLGPAANTYIAWAISPEGDF